MRRLAIAVPAEQFGADTRTGAGRVWASVLPELRRHARVRAAGRVRLRRPDAWLLPAQGRPISAREPIVAVVHGSAWLLDPQVLELMPSSFAAPFVANAEATLERASVSIVPSDYTRRGLTQGFGVAAEQVFVVPHGVDVDVFNPGRRGGRTLVARALGRDTPYVLFASIPTIRQKNLAALRAAMTALAQRGLPHALVIAGGTAGGESPAELAEITAELPGFRDRVVWLGHVEDGALAGLMAEADAFCLPSLYEAFGLTALEAIACGAPTVVSSTGALPEVIGDAGLLAEPAPEALAEALERVIGDGVLAARLRDAGPERARTMTWERTAHGWLEALRHAAGSA